ncbi:EpsG family protein [Pantoea sp. LS15]|uniref:EpsG family protein n=1 Tax=Enterobacterales TaxID=91347 RepID=UPI000E0EFB42|nr:MULTISPECIES: EpsG family protein [Enterobacterales]NJQ19135.1 EpsG family protein [Pantoea sp. LS15]NKF45731.1 EpsG family protein [Pantoea sp. LS15]RDK16032.1 EpsG family protein [Enterobacter sp. 9-2]
MYWIYSLALLLITSLLDRGRYSTIIYKLSLFIFFIAVTGNYYNGIDWINYQHHYSSLIHNGTSVGYLTYEPGFMLVMYFFGYIIGFENFHSVVFFSCAISVLAFSKFINNVPYKFNRSLFIFITLAFIYPLFNDAIRQLLAFSILLPFLPNIDKCTGKKIILICICASMFHASAILMIPVLILLKMRLSKQNMLIMLIFASVFIIILLSLNAIVSSLGSILPQLLYAKLISYLSKISDLKLGFFAVIDCLGLLLIYFISRNDNEECGRNVYAMGGYIFFLFHLAFYTAPFLQRLLYYIFPLLVIHAQLIFFRGNISSITKLLLPVTFVMAISVFMRNITNPYYASDFFQPKFFYTNILSSNPYDIDLLKSKKCIVIDEFDPEFCPR